MSRLLVGFFFGLLALANDFETRVPWEIFKTIPKRYYQTSPPMDRCGNGFLSILAESIGLDLNQMPSLPFAIDVSLQDMPNIEEDFDKAMAEVRYLIDQQQPTRSSKKNQWEPSSLFSTAWGSQYQVKSAIHSLVNLLKTPEARSMVTDYIRNHPEFKEKLAEFVPPTNITDPIASEVKCAEKDGMCRLIESPFDEAQPKLDLSYDLMSMPDVLTGFLTSRLMSRIISEVLGSIIVRLKTGISIYATANVLMDSPMLNLGGVVCRASDYSYLTDFEHAWPVCGFISLLAAGLGCSQSTSLKCATAHLSATPDWGNCEKFPTPKDEPVMLNLVPQGIAFVDGEITPEALEVDGRVLYYMWMACLGQTSWSSTQGLCEKGPNPIQLVPGWDRVIEVWSRQEALALLPAVGKEAVPLATLSRRGHKVIPYKFDPTEVDDNDEDDNEVLTEAPGTSGILVREASARETTEEPPTCDFLLTQRGTLNAFEWDVNFDAQQTAGPGGAMHRGYKSLADSVLPVFDHWLEKNVFQTGECSYADTTIHITGHSLGGGLSEVYASIWAEKYAPLGVKIELVTFAPSHGIDAEQTERLKEMANVRSVIGALDMIPEFPCHNKHGLTRCDDRRNMIFRGEGQDPPYGAHINSVYITEADMAAINPVYSKKKIIDIEVKISLISQSVSDYTISAGIPSPLNIVGWHVCAYSCWLSSRFCTDDSSLWHMCETCSMSL